MLKQLFGLGLFLGLCISAPAQEDGDRLKVMFDLTYASRYVAHGLNIGDDKASIQPSVFLQNVFTSGQASIANGPTSGPCTTRTNTGLRSR